MSFLEIAAARAEVERRLLNFEEAAINCDRSRRSLFWRTRWGGEADRDVALRTLLKVIEDYRAVCEGTAAWPEGQSHFFRETHSAG
jgi:hypothetical protein